VENVPPRRAFALQDRGLAGEVACGQLRSTAIAGPGSVGGLLKGEAPINMSSSATLSKKEAKAAARMIVLTISVVCLD
jgi:hypothetical protein